MKKKILFAISLIVCMAVCAFTFTACGNASQADGNGLKVNADGTYYLYERDTLIKTDWLKLNGEAWSDDDGANGNYEYKDGKITFYVDLSGSKEILAQGTLSDGVITLSNGIETTVYCKEGKTPPNSGTQPTTPADKITITYDANGGTFSGGSSTYSQSVDKGTLLTAPDSPTRANYTFAGWSTAKNGKEMWKFDENKISGAITLYAKWTEMSASVLSVDGASIEGNKIFMFVDHAVDSVSLANKVVCSSDSVWRLYYDKLGQTEIPTKIAAGMGGELLNGDNTFYMVVSSQNGAQTGLYELTVHRSYAVHVDFYNESALLKSDMVYTGNEYTVNYVPEIEGYTFNCWKGIGGGTAESKFTVWSGIDFFADKTPNEYTVTLDVNGGNELQTTEGAVTYDSDYSLTVPAKMGHTFLGWYNGSTQVTDLHGSSLSAWKYTQNITLTARWEANTYTITAVSDNTNGGTVTGGGDYQYDDTVTLAATTQRGYTFIGWYDDNGDKVSSQLTYSAKVRFDTTYTAKWIKVTSVSENANMGTVSSLSGTYMPGDSATVTATTKSGYTFTGWYNGDTKLSGELSYTFEMPSENTTFTARWIACPVTVRSNNSNYGTVGMSSTTVLGEQYTATATTKTGYTFTGWYDGDTKLTDELSYTFEMPSENATYIAKWIKVTPVSENSSKGTVSTLLGTYKSGDSATVTATTQTGYTFIGWYNGNTKLSDELSYTFEMPTQDATYTAKWIKVTPVSESTLKGTVSTLSGKYKSGDS